MTPRLLSTALLASVAALSLLPVTLTAAAAPTTGSSRAVSPASPGKPQLGDFGIDLTGMDKTAAAGDDFYRYVNGAWDDRTQIPADRSSWGGFAVLRDLSDQRTRAILEDMPKAAQAPATARAAGQLYASFMDEAGIEARGIKPLGADLAAINAISSPTTLSEAFARASRDGVGAPIRVGISIDAKDPDTLIVGIGQGGLGLPDRDYYLATDNPRFAAARTAYKAHVATMLRLAAIADPEAKADAILALETAVARAHWTRVEARQAEKRYNPTPVAELGTRFPGVDWPAFLGAVGLSSTARVNVSQPSAIAQIAPLLSSVPLDTWKAYLTYRTISARANVLPKAFVDEDFAFEKVLSGTPELKARWKRGVDFANAGMGEAVGQVYVARYFPPAAKAKADELVRNLLTAMRGRLAKVDWMAPETRTKALEKLAAFRPKIGYPDHWENYAGLRIDPNDAYGNEVRFTRFDFDKGVARLAKPADRSLWSMTPQTVNAYANQAWTEIVFPAAILQPPFFDASADDAVNYGAIGAVIGHEISHHFDDQGRKYDAHGKLADWWTPEDVTRFKSYTDRVVAQYSAYEPRPGLHVNGALTLGENMADLAGLTMAYDAYRLSLGGKPAPVLHGFTGDQRFFMAFAQVYRNKMRDAALERQLTTDPHTPGAVRPNVVRNLDSWYAAFAVKPGMRAYLPPAERVRVW